MKTFVKHIHPATLETRWKSRSPTPPRSFLSTSSSSDASSPEPSRRVPSPGPLCFKMRLFGLPHTVPLSQMHPPNSLSQSSFLGASSPMTRCIDSLLSLRMGTLVTHHFTIMDATLSISSTSGGDVRTPVPRTQLNAAPPPPPGLEVQPPLCSHHAWYPCQSSSRATAFATCSCLYFVRCVIHTTATPFLQPQVSTSQVGTHSARSSHAHKRPLREPTLPLVQTHVLDVALPRSLGL